MKEIIHIMAFLFYLLVIIPLLILIEIIAFLILALRKCQKK